jgi:hypothetical protein
VVLLLLAALFSAAAIGGRARAQAADDLDQLNHEKAEALLKRAVSIREKAFGPDSPEIVGSLEALAGLYEAAGRKPEADELWVTIHAIQKQSPQPHFMLMEEPTYAVVKVYYATDRAKTTNPDPAKTYAGDRGDLGLGFCTVSIPRDHRMGALEAPSIWRLEFSNDPEHFVVLLSVTEDRYGELLQGRGRQGARLGGQERIHFRAWLQRDLCRCGATHGADGL